MTTSTAGATADKTACLGCSRSVATIRDQRAVSSGVTAPRPCLRRCSRCWFRCPRPAPGVTGDDEPGGPCGFIYDGEPHGLCAASPAAATPRPSRDFGLRRQYQDGPRGHGRHAASFAAATWRDPRGSLLRPLQRRWPQLPRLVHGGVPRPCPHRRPGPCHLLQRSLPLGWPWLLLAAALCSRNRDETLTSSAHPAGLRCPPRRVAVPRGKAVLLVLPGAAVCR